METKKILMVSSFYPPYHVGGAGTHVYYLANELVKKGHEVHVLYSKDAYHLKRKYKPCGEKYVNRENIHLHELKSPLGKFSAIYSYIFGLVPFKKKILQTFNQRYDLIHYHNISLLGPKVLKYGRSKKIYTAHDHWLVCPFNDFFNGKEICNNKNCGRCLIRNKRPPQLWRYFGMLKKSLKDVELIISPSNYLKKFLIKNSIKQRIVTIPNFVPEPPEIKKNNGLKNYFFYAGMLEGIKGIPNLLKAFRDSDRKLVIAGKGNLERYMKGFIAKNKLHRRIRYVGWLEDEEIYKYYKNALAFILPSLCPENCPLTILEALSIGTPVMGSNVGGIPEIIEKVDKDLILNYNDVDDLKEKTKVFERKKYNSDEIRKAYKRYFSSDVYVKNYLKTINF